MIQSRTICATVVLLGATLATAAAPAVAAPPAAPAAATACPTGWGSGDKAAGAATAESVRNVRTGRHDCYDRMVVDVPGAARGDLGYSVRYVDRLHQDGSGRHIPVSGGAVLEVRVTAPAYDPGTGAATYPARAGRPLPGSTSPGTARSATRASPAASRATHSSDSGCADGCRSAYSSSTGTS